jgi:hypothetical protein
MLSGVAAGDLPLTLARRILVVLIAAAVAMAPVGAASAAHAPQKPLQAQAMHHDHGAMQMAAKKCASPHCISKAAHRSCCDDENTCAQTCLQKCFGQMAVMPPERTARIALAFRVAPLPVERPPGWSSAPQPPPPRA